MEQTFKVARGKGAFYSLVIGTAMELIMAVATFAVCFYLGLGILVFTALIVWGSCASARKSVYVISDNKIIVKIFLNKKQIYPIDKIQKIEYVDTATEWNRSVPNARHQIYIYFDRKFIKSVEPRSFAPENRHEFVAAIIEQKPDIIVDENERVI